MKDSDRICSRLKQARIDQGLTLEEVESRSGIASSAVALIEERQHAFSLDELKRLAAAYRVPVSLFFRDAEESARGPADEPPSPAAGEKATVKLVRMDENSEASWLPPASGTLHIYVVSGRVIVQPEGTNAVILDESGACRCTTSAAARVRALKPTSFYLTCVRS